MRLLLVILASLILTVIGIFVLNFADNETSTVHVPTDVSTISEALKHVESGGTIYIAPGIYDEAVEISKSISLLGAEGGVTIISGGLGGSSNFPTAISIFNPDRNSEVQIEIRNLQIVADENSPVHYGIGLFNEGRVALNVRDAKIATNFGIVDFTGNTNLQAENTTLNISELGISFISSLDENNNSIELNSIQINANPEQPGIARGLNIINAELSLTDTRIDHTMVGLVIFNSKADLHTNHISANETGIVAMGNSSITMESNVISDNSNYGFVLFVSDECPEISSTNLAFDSSSLSPFTGTVEGSSNQLRDNGRSNICPADYPLPEGFLAEEE